MDGIDGLRRRVTDGGRGWGRSYGKGADARGACVSVVRVTGVCRLVSNAHHRVGAAAAATIPSILALTPADGRSPREAIREDGIDDLRCLTDGGRGWGRSYGKGADGAW